jgi:hypothetical protein
MPRRTVIASLALAAAACAAPEPPVEWRVLVTLRQPTTDPAVVARIVGTAAGVPARAVAAASPKLHAVALRCSGAQECAAAVERLRTDPVNVEAVQIDERKRILTP